MTRIYIVHSLTQLSPQLWRTLGHPYVMVSADDVARKLEYAVKVLDGLDVLVDSGGYRMISRRRQPSPEKVLTVQRILVDKVGAMPVLLDTPVPEPLRADSHDFHAANKATARNARIWAREFGDHFVYPLHAHTPSQLDEALHIARKAIPSVEAYGLGSLALLARYRPAKLVELVAYARERLPARLHVFGVGNSVAVLLALAGLADSIDTSSPLADARYGVVRDPQTYSTLVVAGNKRGRRVEAEDVALRCPCPVCRREPRLLAEWGRAGVLARTLHNAFHLLEAVRDPRKGVLMVLRNRGLRPVLAKLGLALEDYDEALVGASLPDRLG